MKYSDSVRELRRGGKMAVLDNVRIIAGTILGGVFGSYDMQRAEISYKEKMNERLRQYQIELEKKEKLNQHEESL